MEVYRAVLDWKAFLNAPDKAFDEIKMDVCRDNMDVVQYEVQNDDVVIDLVQRGRINNRMHGGYRFYGRVVENELYIGRYVWIPSYSEFSVYDEFVLQLGEADSYEAVMNVNIPEVDEAGFKKWKQKITYNPKNSTFSLNFSNGALNTNPLRFEVNGDVYYCHISKQTNEVLFFGRAFDSYYGGSGVRISGKSEDEKIQNGYKIIYHYYRQGKGAEKKE